MEAKYFEQLQYHASNCQMSADEMAYKLVKQEKQNRLNMMCAVLQDHCNFNTYFTIGKVPWIFGIKAINFVFLNHEQIKRKFELGELMDFCDKYRILSVKYNIKNFEDFKSRN